MRTALGARCQTLPSSLLLLSTTRGSTLHPSADLLIPQATLELAVRLVDRRRRSRNLPDPLGGRPLLELLDLGDEREEAGPEGIEPLVSRNRILVLI